MVSTGEALQATLPELLQRHARTQPDSPALTFLADESSLPVSLTYAQLTRRAAVVAAELQRRGLVGKPVLLLFRPGPEYLCALLGCFWASAIAVPAYPPSNRRLGRANTRVAHVVADTRAQVALTTSALAESLQSCGELAGVSLLSIDAWPERINTMSETTLSPHAACLLQYTSGSIAEPKGVVLSHKQLVANLQMLTHANRGIPAGPVVTWLPPYHDMGLVGTLLWPLSVGKPIVQLATESFVRRPVRWLRAMSEHRAVVTAAPNFAFELCVRRVEPRERIGLDLSNLWAVYTGAEPIRAETLDAFADAYGACGFRREAFVPSYGMAETTLFVTGSPARGQPTVLECSVEALTTGRARLAHVGEASRRIVGCGMAAEGATVRIVDPTEQRPLDDGAVGEIWIQAPSVASGYWHRTEETQTTFGARLADTEHGPFLRTGDLGFLVDAELFIVGRLKDVIIAHGVKHHAHDIERTIQRLDTALVSDAGAAFAIELNGAEQVCVVQEIDLRSKPDSAQLLQAIAAAVQAEHGVALHAVVLVKRGSAHKTASGKIMRHAIRAAFLDGSLPVIARWQATPADSGVRVEGGGVRLPRVTATRSIAAIELFVRAKVAERTLHALETIEIDVPLAQYGVDSLVAAALAEDLEGWLDTSVEPTIAYDFPTVRGMAQALARVGATRSAEIGARPSSSARAFESGRDAVAIVGMACRFPGARDLAEFWQLLQQGRDAVSEVPASRGLERRTASHAGERRDVAANRFGGFLEKIEYFDAAFFGITPREATRMDPQQRLFLEVAWDALEDACIAPCSLAKSETGVFAAVCGSDHALLHGSDLRHVDADFGMGHAASIVANRVSYLFDLKGPSLAYDGACASSLIALHAACQCLLAGETQLAIVGGVNAVLAPQAGLFLANARALAQDGRCKTFDRAADGFARSEGCGIVIVKRLSQALADGDRVYAQIEGSAIAHSGATNGLMAPSASAQVHVIRRALDKAGIDAGALDYVEAHGVGAPVADTLELRALAEVLGTTSRQRPCFVGSVKTNIGHLEAAAGIASVIKTALALAHEEIPRHLHLRAPHEVLLASDQTLAVPILSESWRRCERPRFAGVSAFGLGGANAHVVLGEAPASDAVEARFHRPSHILCLSARSEAALARLATRYAAVARALPVADLCFSANVGRQHFRHRAAFVASDGAELCVALERFAERQAGVERSLSTPKLCFLFALSSIQFQACRQLYETHPVFRCALETACDWLSPQLRPDALATLSTAHPSAAGWDSAEIATGLSAALAYAQWSLLLSLGVAPTAYCGQGAGEYLAASAAGALPWQEGLRLAVRRAQLSASTASAPESSDVSLQVDQEITRGARSATQHWLCLASCADPLAPGSLLPPGCFDQEPGHELQTEVELVRCLARMDCDVACVLGAAPSGLTVSGANYVCVEPDYRTLHVALAKLYSTGVDIDWRAFDAPFSRQKCSLPHYPFERERYWIELPGTESVPELGRGVALSSSHPLLRRMGSSRHASDDPGQAASDPSGCETG